MIPGSANPLLLASAAAAGGYAIERSLRFNSSDSAYLSRTPASAGNRKTWTWAGWVKRSGLGVNAALFGRQQSDDTNTLDIRFGTGDTLRFADFNTYLLETTQVFRDTSAWFHLVVALDTTQATANNRARMYVNGVEITQFGTRSNPTQNADLAINNTTLHHLGATVSGGSATYYFPGYLADIHFIDGQALTPTSFGEFDDNDIWQPKAYTGSYGTNGFRLDFADNSSNTATTLGKDTSGNGNNWTPNNLSVTAGAGNDSLVDVPTNGAETDTGAGGEVRGNYATLNPLNLTASSSHALTNGNLEVIGGTGWTSDVTTFPTGATGKWYAEITLAGTFASSPFVGIAKNTSITSSYIGSSSDSYGYRADATKWNGASSAYGATYTAGDTIGIAYDADAGTLVFYKNGVSQGTAYSGLSGSYFIGGSFWTSSTTVNAIANFGQRPFAYTAPSGFKALNTANLPAPLVTKPNTVMDVALYTGNGGSQSITLPGGFNPDLVWVKSRSNSQDHYLFDAIRGGAGILRSNTTGAETTGTTYLSFDTSGFSSLNGLSSSGYTYAGWCWDAGSSTVTNTQGSISSQVRANASAGFSVVTYTGTGANATVGHGLGVAPGMVIVKRRNTTGNWQVRHTSIAAASSIQLNLTDAAASATTVWDSTAPSSTVFSVGTDATVNASGGTYVAYCFAPVTGYSSFGSYTGNGSADGPFVYTGFRPRWVMIKSTGSDDRWTIQDTSRSSYNTSTDTLAPNLSSAELANAFNLDINSNGFKVRSTNSGHNTSSVTYIYAAFAEHPFNFSRAR
jgi:hypothetical protein